MLELNFFIKIFSIGCIQLLLLFLIEKLNLKNFFGQYQGIQKIHDGEILRIGSLFLFLPLIIIYFIDDEFKSRPFNLIIICSSIIIFLTIIQKSMLRRKVLCKMRFCIDFGPPLEGQMTTKRNK